MGQLEHETWHRKWMMRVVSGRFARHALAVFPTVFLQFDGKVQVCIIDWVFWNYPVWVGSKTGNLGECLEVPARDQRDCTLRYFGTWELLKLPGDVGQTFGATKTIPQAQKDVKRFTCKTVPRVGSDPKSYVLIRSSSLFSTKGRIK
jgi:hypothetical protein